VKTTTWLLVVPALDFVTLCVFEVLDSVLVAGAVPALAVEVLDATVSVEVAPADTPVGSAP
jgi:hypothetical protein